MPLVLLSILNKKHARTPKTSCQLQQKHKKIYKRSQLQVLVRMFVDYLVSCNLFGDDMKMATQTKDMQVDSYTVFVPTTNWIHMFINGQVLILKKTHPGKTWYEWKTGKFNVPPVDPNHSRVTRNETIYYYYYLLQLSFSLGGSCPYTSTDKTNKNKYT
jgi:hypothetical protein